MLYIDHADWYIINMEPKKVGHGLVIKSSDQDDESLSVSVYFLGFDKHFRYVFYNPTKCTYSRLLSNSWVNDPT